MTEKTVISTLRTLYRIADAGEKGFATAASNMSVPALKIIFKLYAHQRMTFKEELLEELRRLGSTATPGTSIPGAVHRGRVAIFAGMSEDEGQERVILKETVIGERVAERTYRKALERNLPEQTRALVEQQYREVRRAHEKVRCLRDDVQRRASMRLAENEQDIKQAVQTLMNDGFDADEIETVELQDELLYSGRGATQAETILSGVVGGALWGGVMGIFAGFGVVYTIQPEAGMIFWTWLLTVVGFMMVGAFISAVLAFFISAGVRSHDTYHYSEIRENARFLVQPKVCVPAD